MIQCVGSRNQDNPNCSRVCCQSAVKNAIAIKETSPETDVFILYRDMRTYSMLEEFYTKARNMGVIFSRFSQDDPPKVEKTVMANSLSPSGIMYWGSTLKLKLIW